MSNRLSGLTDHELLAGLQKLRGNERETTLEILHHLIEVERRKLHLKLGYPSMFVYCTEHLCYSESSAGRRVQSARCLARFAQIEPLIQRGDITLVTLGLVASLLTPQNVDWFMEKIRKKRQREVEAIAAAFRPATYLRDRVMRVSVPAPVTPLSSSTTPGLALNPTPGDGATANGASVDAATNAASPANAAAPPTDPTAQPLRLSNENSVSPGPLLVNFGSNSHHGSEKTPKPLATISKLYIQFLADDSFMRDYNEACALLSNSLQRVSFSTVFSAVLRDYLERHSPKRRLERRDAKLAARELRRSPQQPDRVSDSEADTAQTAAPAQDRTQDEIVKAASRDAPRRPAISGQARDAVFVRDQARCTYVGADGHRCGETRGLHVDHIQPVARNGSDELHNLRLLCSRHNQLEAQRLFGEWRRRPYLERQGVQDPRGDAT